MPPDNRDPANDVSLLPPPLRGVRLNTVGGGDRGKKEIYTTRRLFVDNGKISGELGMNCGFMYSYCMVELDRVMYGIFARRGEIYLK